MTFECPVKVLSPFNPDSTSTTYPIRYYDILEAYLAIEDESKVHLLSCESGLTLAERLSRNERITWEMVENERTSNTKTDLPYSHAQSPNEEYSALLIESQSPSVFTIKRGDDLIGHLSVSPSLCRSGETIIGQLTFDDADLTTFQYTVILEEYEEVQALYSPLNECSELVISQMSKQDHIIWQRNRSTFRLGIPLSAQPTIISNLMKHQYRIRLELHVADPRSSVTNPPPKWLGCTPDSQLIERFELSVPIVVLPFPLTTGLHQVKFSTSTRTK